jgi:hypothetical protein
VKEETGPVFCHSIVDDFGFSAAEIRVLLRVARREECWEGAQSMARGCQLSKETVKRALRVLVACRALKATARPGRETIFKVNPISKWSSRAEVDLAWIRTEAKKGRTVRCTRMVQPESPEGSVGPRPTAQQSTALVARTCTALTIHSNNNRSPQRPQLESQEGSVWSPQRATKVLPLRKSR